MTARFTVIRGGDEAPAAAFAAELAGGHRLAGGAVPLRSRFTPWRGSAAALARVIVQRLAPDPAEMEARAFTRSSGAVAPVPLPPGPLAPHRVTRLLSDEATLVLQKVDQRSLGWARLARSLELTTGQPAQINLYAGPENTSGLAWHRDPHDVLVLQLAGSKHFGLARDLSPEGPVGAESVGVQAGDVLWVPRGVPHQASNGPDGSLHAALGLLHLTRGSQGLQRASDSDAISLSPGRFPEVAPDLLGETLEFLLRWRRLPPPRDRPGRARIRPGLLGALLEDASGTDRLVVGDNGAPLSPDAGPRLTVGKTPEAPDDLAALEALGALSCEPAVVDFAALIARAEEEMTDGA